MKKKLTATKKLWLMLAASAIALSATVGISIATGVIMSREDSAVIQIDQSFESIEIKTAKTKVAWQATDGKSSVEAFAKAWREQPFDVDELIDVRVENGVLIVEGDMFPSDFMGIFPQPYELNLTISAPQEVIDANGGLQ